MRFSEGALPLLRTMRIPAKSSTAILCPDCSSFSSPSNTRTPLAGTGSRIRVVLVVWDHRSSTVIHSGVLRPPPAATCSEVISPSVVHSCRNDSGSTTRAVDMPQLEKRKLPPLAPTSPYSSEARSGSRRMRVRICGMPWDGYSSATGPSASAEAGFPITRHVGCPLTGCR